MKSLMKSFLFGVLFFGQVVLAETQPKEIRIGFIPAGDREMLKKGAFELAKELQSAIGIPVTVYITKNYSGMIGALKEKKVDFSFLTSSVFVLAEKETQLKVLLKKVWAEPYYYSLIISKKDSKIQKFEDLKNKKIAFVDQKSTSGYLYPLAMMKKRNLNDSFFKEIKFSGSHSQSVNLLESGEVDAIAIFGDDAKGENSAWKKYVKNKGNEKNYRVVWFSDPIPNDPFCVRQEFYDQNPKLVHNLMFSLIDVVEKLKTKKEVSEFIGANGFLPATSKQYDPVREMMKHLKLGVD